MFDSQEATLPPASPEPVVTATRSGPVLTITLNRPQSLNAINSTVAARLGEIIEELHTDPELRVAVITGAGRAFCAGADLKAIASGESIYDTDHPEWGFAGLVAHFTDKPLIAAVNGVALGGGTEIVLACDLAVLSTSASLGLPEVRRGLVAAAGGLLRLPEQIPPKLAAEAILTGTPIDAESALRWGLVNRLAAPDDVLSVATELAQRIGANAPLAVQASKRIMHRRTEFGSSWAADVWAMNKAEYADVRRSADAREGASAFAEKRQPQWSVS